MPPMLARHHNGAASDGGCRLTIEAATAFRGWTQYPVTVQVTSSCVPASANSGLPLSAPYANTMPSSNRCLIDCTVSNVLLPIGTMTFLGTLNTEDPNPPAG